MLKEINNKFIEIYGVEASEVFFAPGRVNLIGEHIDYNGGLVLPCALSCGTYMLVSERDDDLVFFSSANFDYKEYVDLKNLKDSYEEWVKYPVGVISQLQKGGYELKGLNVLFFGNIPNGAGLSSSASIEVVTAYALNEINNCGLSKIDLVKLSQKAENEYVGVNCGIMDQFAVGMGKKDNALLLNCNTLDYKEVSTSLKDYKLVISNTNKPRKLIDSKYNERRKECDDSLALISTRKTVQYLCELSNIELEDMRDLFDSDILWKRTQHVVGENERVKLAAAAMIEGDLSKLGKLMNESHDSLRDLYEVTGYELDTLVDESRKIDGVLGSRMTGAGFGGCTVSIVREDKIDEFISTVGINYKKKTNLTPEFYVAEIGDGVHRING